MPEPDDESKARRSWEKKRRRKVKTPHTSKPPKDAYIFDYQRLENSGGEVVEARYKSEQPPKHKGRRNAFGSRRLQQPWQVAKAKKPEPDVVVGLAQSRIA